MMKITLTANAGILVETCGLHILVDAVHEKATRFSGVPGDVLTQIVQGTGAFEHIAYMLITHAHPDHYSESLVQQFMQRHRGTELIAPIRVPGIRPFRQIRVAGAGGTISLPLAEINYVRLAHEGEEYAGVLNYGYRVETQEDSFIVLGDAAEADVRRGLEELMTAGPADAVFVNFPLITLGSGRDALRQCGAKEVFVFHLPFEQDDSEHYRESARRMLPRARDVLGVPITLLEDPGQTEKTGSAF